MRTAKKIRQQVIQFLSYLGILSSSTICGKNESIFGRSVVEIEVEVRPSIAIGLNPIHQDAADFGALDGRNREIVERGDLPHLADGIGEKEGVGGPDLPNPDVGRAVIEAQIA